MDHGDGVMSHVQCGFNYFDPYGHEGKGQDQPTITIWGTEGNMGLVGYDWAPFGVDLATRITRRPQRFVPDTGTMSGSRAPASSPNRLPPAPSRGLQLSMRCTCSRSSKQRGRQAEWTQGRTCLHLHVANGVSSVDSPESQA